MKILKIQKNKGLPAQAGMLTIELLIAFAILLISVTGIVLLTQSEQTMTLDAKTTTDALALAQKKIEVAKAEAKNDFDGLDSEAVEVIGSLYNVKLDVLQISECVKKLTSTVSWSTWNKNRDVKLDTRVTDLSDIDILGGECDLGPNDDWDNPGEAAEVEIGGQGASAIDSLNGYVYLTSDPSAPGKKDFFIYKFIYNSADPENSTLIEEASLDLSLGLNDVEVVKIGTKIYAYLMNNNNVNYAVDPDNDPSIYEQLIILDVTDPSSVDPADAIKISLPGIEDGSSYPEGRVVHYYDGRLYIGTWETAGPEFHIFDTTSDPENPTHEGSLELTHSIRDIIVRDNFAYLATTDNNHELMVIDIENPGSLEHPDDSGLGYNTPSDYDGTSVSVLGNNVYLGTRQDSSSGDDEDEFFILNKADVIDNTETFDGVIASKDLGDQSSVPTTGIVVRGNLVFISMDDPTVGLLVIYLDTLEPVSNCTIYNYSENNTDMDMSGDFLFISSNSQKDVRVIFDKTEICS